MSYAVTAIRSLARSTGQAASSTGVASTGSMRPDIEPVLATPVDDAAWPVERASERIAVTA